MFTYVFALSCPYAHTIILLGTFFSHLGYVFDIPGFNLTSAQTINNVSQNNILIH